MVNEREQGSRRGRLRAEMMILGGKMSTLTHQIHLYSENNKTMAP